MALTGHLTEFSLPELFQFVEQGYKTGLLSIQAEPNASNPQGQSHYIWIQGGRIMAMADGLDENCLLSMIQKRGWLNPQALNLLDDCSSVEQPLGLYLKTQGAMSAEQLKLLFHAQVLQRICNLFKLSNGQFAFDTKATLSKTEMTGLSVSASEATLLGLRVLRDWAALAEKLPDPTFGLTKVVPGQPNLQLDSQEWQVWELADGDISLQAIAKKLVLPVETVQQIAFRLAVVGLVEEVPILAPEPKQEPIENTTPEPAPISTKGTGLNQSFLQNLVGFLKTRGEGRGVRGEG